MLSPYMSPVERLWFYSLRILCGLVLLFLVLPVLVIVPLSFNSGTFLVYPLQGFSLRWYADFFQSAEWMRSLTNSMIVAPAATLLAMVFGTLAAIGLTRGEFRGKALVMSLMISPMVVPVVIIGVASYLFFAPLGLGNSYLSLIVVHAVLGVPFVIITVSATLQGFNYNLVRAAASLGAPPLTTFFRVTLPLIAPGVISGALFAFATMQPFAIAPSILSADFARLGEDVDKVLAAGADIVHFDVMDNHYVPNLTIGPMVCSALRKYGVSAPIDVHLMVSPVDRIIGDFIEAGATYITFHPEASQHIDRSLQLIRDGGCKAGLVFNPATPLEVLKYVMDKVDMVLLMSVNPGFGGQKFIPGTLDKLREARALIDASGREIRLEIDGGVNVKNIREIAAAGADTFVAGSAIFNAPDYAEVIRAMHAELAQAHQ